jgi:hypothetical protein
MNRSRFADIGEIVSSVAIVLTLIYLIVEIRQNTEALYAQSRQSVLAGSQTQLTGLMENPEIVTSITKSGPLTAEENIRLNAFLQSALRTREFTWLQYQNGVVDEPAWRTEVAIIQFIFDSQRTRDWWAAVGRRVYAEEFSSFVDDLLDSQPPTETSWQATTEWAGK